MENTLKGIIDAKEKEIILIFSRGTKEDLVIDVFTKGNFTLSNTDKAMLKNMNLLEVLDSLSTQEGQN